MSPGLILIRNEDFQYCNRFYVKGRELYIKQYLFVEQLNLLKKKVKQNRRIPVSNKLLIHFFYNE